MTTPDRSAARSGRVVILNGAPRSGKTSIATALQADPDELWVALGVDASQATTPARLQPGAGLRPGGERPDLEPVVALLWRALYASVAAHARLGIDVVVDAVHHEDFSRPLGVLPDAARALVGLPVLFVGVRCPTETVRQRRRDTWGGTGHAPAPPGVGGDPVARWESAVHVWRYDLEVDTSLLDPDACARLVRQRLHDGGRSRLHDLR